MKAFKAYDIRGVYNEDFHTKDVYRIGFYLPALLNTQKILVGQDIRNTSEEIFDSLVSGIIDAGASVYDAGLATTPMIYYLTAEEGFDASVMITASHNSKEYNGFKISGKDARPIGYENGLQKLEQMIRKKPEPSARQGKIIPFNRKNKYFNFLETYKTDFSNLKLAIDCSNGVAGLFAEKLFGPAPEYMNLGMDGDFPGHNPNPLEEKNLTGLKKTVRKNKCDLGVIFDGDADRVMFIDEKGEFIRPDLIIALLGEHFLDRQKTATVLHDIRTSRAVTQKLEEMGAHVQMWKVGRAFAALKLKEINGLFGGELAGHYYFRDFHYSDSGLLAALIVLNIVSKLKAQGQSISEYFSGMLNMHNSGEVNFRIENKSLAMEKIHDYFQQDEKPDAIHDFDGLRVEFKDWWFNVRPSNTEPYLRFIAECESKEKLEQVLQDTKNIIEEVKNSQ